MIFLIKFPSYYFMSLPTVVESDPKAPFSIATTPRSRGGDYLFPSIAPLTLEQLYLIMLSVKKESSTFFFFSFFMTLPGIEPRCSEPLANILTIMPMSQNKKNLLF